MALMFNPHKLIVAHWQYESKITQDMLADMVMPVISVIPFYPKSRILQDEEEKAVAKNLTVSEDTAKDSALQVLVELMELAKTANSESFKKFRKTISLS
jgi:hypothetical protein